MAYEYNPIIHFAEVCRPPLVGSELILGAFWAHGQLAKQGLFKGVWEIA
jgi:hypothetical protein